MEREPAILELLRAAWRSAYRAAHIAKEKTMNTRRLAFISLILSLALAACASQATSGPHSVVPVASDGNGAGTTTSNVDNFASLPPGQGGSGPAVADQSVKGVAPNAARAATDRIVVKTASLSLVVKDPSDAAQRITTLATGMGGFVVSSNTAEASVDAHGNKIMQASLTVRVPSAQLDSALTQIRAMAVEVKNVSVAGQDVTAQYTDLQSQLRNAEAAEAKLTEIMNAATKTEDVMAVFNQLTQVRQQVEQLKGQIQYYDESASMSAISMDLLPDALNQPIEVGGWQPQGVAKDALESLLHAFQSLATGAIWVGLYILPLALVIGLPLFVVLRLVARRLRRAKPVTA